MAVDHREKAWVFHFALEAEAEHIAWVEERKLQIGGGFHAAAIEDAPLVPQRLLGSIGLTGPLSDQKE